MSGRSGVYLVCALLWARNKRGGGVKVRHLGYYFYINSRPSVNKTFKSPFVLSDCTSNKLLFIFVSGLWDQKFCFFVDFNFKVLFLQTISEKVP